VHEQDQRDLVHLQCAVALAHLHLVEPAAIAQPLLDARKTRRIERRAGRDAGQLDHHGVGQRRVAVDADFGDFFLCRT